MICLDTKAITNKSLIEEEVILIRSERRFVGLKWREGVESRLKFLGSG